MLDLPEHGIQVCKDATRGEDVFLLRRGLDQDKLRLDADQ